ncbi:hypothetical protein JY651_27430 [Pyxidicoccus parkwayensis]|uniref:Lipoprotein n=1 Tax=Pyxidicoccus parkwayensis TaxID=2813578 RepID=A0ABX7NJN2_9BACT|nr:hypothetical protein [Pyxidicoccus parkwaysis]QSQ19080.1 hypothetical protein JY651_27430 [Pyxidicoccus parkwaysis]
MRLLPPIPRALLSACVLLLSVLSGCKDAPAPGPSPDASTQTPGEDSGTDAGTVVTWDGGYTALEEHGDWEDRGRFAPCTFDSQGNPSSVSCEDLARYDLSQCDADALASVESFGIYGADVRAETRLADGGTRISGISVGFKLEADGGGTLSGTPFRNRIMDGGTFFLSTARTGPLPGTTLTALAGCKVPSPGIITGCYARCRDGRFTQSGTFEAHRIPWAGGEPESSGGMRLLSESPVLLGEAVDVYVTKNHAYVVSLPARGIDGGLTVFDVTDREHPIFKASISLPGDNYWNGVWAKGDALYVASSATGVVVFDISNPGAPEFVRTVPGTGDFGAHTVLVDGDRLYAMSAYDPLLVFDVSHPLQPVLRQTISPPPDGNSAPHDAFAYEGRLYVSNSFGGYAVLDVTDLDNVRFLGQYVHGNYAHNSAVGTFAGRTIAFEGAESAGAHVRVLDVTDPAHIVKMGEFKMRPVTSVHNILLKGTRLYVAWYQEGVRVLDVSIPPQPRQVAHFNTFRETHPEATDTIGAGTFGIRVPDDGYVYAADSLRGLLIFNEP